MIWNETEFFPVMGVALTSANTLPLDFTSANLGLEKLDLVDTAGFEKHVLGQLKQAGKTFGIGGYLEKRAIYRRSEVFGNTASNFRNVHLGIDIWTRTGASVFAPLDGKIHSFRDNEGFGNYGPTIILEHEIEGERLFSLYGHLFRSDLEKLEVGKGFKAGDLLCHVGDYPENGDWPAHLHLQLIRDLGDYWGDYPGVATEKDLDYYRKNCPDPNGILRFKDS